MVLDWSPMVSDLIVIKPLGNVITLELERDIYVNNFRVPSQVHIY